MVDVRLIREALRLLDVEQFVLGVHDASFPLDDAEDPGRGTPYGRGASRLFAYAAQLGFNGVQLGPQGATHRGSPSPYEATLFSRNPLNLPLGALVERGLLSPATAEEAVRRSPAVSRERMAYAHVFSLYDRLLDEVRARGLADASWRARAEAYLSRNEGWLLPDALYEVLCRLHRRPYWREWAQIPGADLDLRLFDPRPGEEAAAAARIAELRAAHHQELLGYALVQAVLEEEHAALRARLSPLGVALYGDLQVGYSAQDSWAYGSLFLRHYRMGAPPSRTNPEGQPWGYSVLDPARQEAVLRFVRARVEHHLAAYDGLRIDHPHGWIDPWVYRIDVDDPFEAVRAGARLFSSPDVAGHAALARFAIAQPEQLNRDVPRFADDWVRALGEEQVARYAAQIDVVVEQALAHGRDRRRLVCEVLSTLPYPVARVLERHGLGRFRVLQKSKLDDDADVYRAANAQPSDWIMLGNHDTPPIWRVVQTWRDAGVIRARAEDVARRVTPEGGDAGAFASRLSASAGELVHALLADAFLSRARNVYIFFPDLFGQAEIYNAPGTVNEENWTLRVPPSFERDHPVMASARRALDVPWALALALRARGGEQARALADALTVAS